MRNAINSHRWVAIIVALFVVLAVTYSLVTPIFEASDEFLHYPLVQHIATTWSLPVQHPREETLWGQEGSQPPLYYYLSAGLTAWIDTSNLTDVHVLNPHGKIGLSTDPDNKNIVIHTAREAFPWQGAVLAVHLIRLFSVALSTGAVILTYVIVHDLWPDRRWVALLATALVAFNPMFLFITGSVNNDNLVILLCTWTLLLVVRILKDGVTVRRAATLAVVVPLATVSKVSGVTLVPLVGLALLISAWRRHEWKRAILAALALAAAWALIAGWWYLRNIRLYGELFGTQMMVQMAGPRETPMTLWALRKEWYGFWVAYWAWFGGVDILADPLVYRFYGVVCWAALLGLAWWVAQTIHGRRWDEFLIPGLFALQIGVTFAGLVAWTLQTYGSQGRLMFPVIAAISALMALGLLNWLPEKWHMYGAGVVAMPMLAIAAISPFRYIAPAYAQPPTVAVIPEGATPVGAVYNGLEIVAVETGREATQASGRVPVTLYLRAGRPLDTNYSLYLHALGRDVQQIGKIDTYPGGGSLPATLMQPGVIYKDAYSIALDPAFNAPTRVRIEVGVGLFGGSEYIVEDGVMPDGTQVQGIIVDDGVAYPHNLAGCTGSVPGSASITAILGGFAQMWAMPVAGQAAPGDSVLVTLYWDRLADPGLDWTVFVHLDDANGQNVANADGPPLSGDYPTSLWLAACEVKDVHTLNIPADLAPGMYLVKVGMYNANDPTYVRATAVGTDGSPYPDYAVPLGSIEVTR